MHVDVLLDVLRYRVACAICTNGHCADKIMSTYQKYTGLNQIEERSIAGGRRPAWADTASTAHMRTVQVSANGDYRYWNAHIGRV